MIGRNPMSSGMNATGARTAMGPSATGRNIIPKGYKRGQLAQFSPEQMQLFQSLFGNLGPESFLSKLAGGDQSQFEELEAPALRQFNALQGNISSRFSGAGMGARKSSGFQNTLSQASSDFAQQLQSQRLGLQRQAISDLLGLSNQLLGQRPHKQFLVEKQKRSGGLGGLIGAGVGGVGGFFAGGPGGALTGAQLGQQLGSTF
jgi:hypothetical protein